MVGIGAIPGAWLRLRVVNHLEPMVPHKHWGTFSVNLIAAFSLGLVLAMQDRCAPGRGGAPLLLLVGTGFFGSLSTFSTFAVELLNTLRERRFGSFAVLALGSLLGGLLAAGAGYSLGQT